MSAEKLVKETKSTIGVSLFVSLALLTSFFSATNLSCVSGTSITPEDTFSSIGWWITLGVLLFSLFAPFIFRHMMKET
ncbi:hypothetical protein ACQ4XT_18765 [Halobacillus faecis]